MNTIFHAFNMKYSTIGELAPSLKELGFTHVQFPPIQACRALTEADGNLIRAQLRIFPQHLSQFSSKCIEANTKEKAYNHTFDYLLKQRIYYINQPTLKTFHEILASGTRMENMYEIAYETLVSNPKLASPAFKAIIEIGALGERSRWYPIQKAIDIMLEGVSIEEPFIDTTPSKQKHNNLEKIFVEYIKHKSEPPQSLLLEKKQAQLELLRARGEYNKYEKSLQLQNYIPITAALRNDLLKETKFTLNQKKQNLLRFFNTVLALEFMMYPPWWLIYQPLRLTVGNTFLGSKADIYSAINACKKTGLEIIADVVVNNLAAVAGERSSWEPYANPEFHSMSVMPYQFKKLQTLLFEALGTDDLSCVTPPFDCGGTQEPTQCWMSQALPQLNQNHPAVKKAQANFLTELVMAGVDGVRIDAAVHLAPQDCERIIKPFNGLSYIEYVGGSESWRKYPANMYDHVRMEDFAIGECLYMSVFGANSALVRTVNYGGTCLTRHNNLDSVVMIVNHDQVMGSIPSRIFSDLPSQASYELSVAYLIQRIYGNVLLMPHDIQLEIVREALQFRSIMRKTNIVKEHVVLSHDILEMYSYKYTEDEQCLFVSVINMHDHVLETQYGSVQSHGFAWFTLPAQRKEPLTKLYNRRTMRWMTNLYDAKKKSFTRKVTHKK
jgi:hypothetical protein